MQPLDQDAFYRVSVKALVFDEVNRLLVLQDTAGEWEMPGGGWEHGETLEGCIRRELEEEMNVVPSRIGAVQFIYTSIHEKGYHKLCIAVPVSVESQDFTPQESDLVASKFITKEEFHNGVFQQNERGVQACAAKIWPES